MVTTATRHHRRTPAGTLRTATPFFTVLAARHGIPAPDAPTPASVPRQVVGRISLVLNVGVVGSARPRCTSLGRFHEMASWGRSSLYSIR